MPPPRFSSFTLLRGRVTLLSLSVALFLTSVMPPCPSSVGRFSPRRVSGSACVASSTLVSQSGANSAVAGWRQVLNSLLVVLRKILHACSRVLYYLSRIHSGVRRCCLQRPLFGCMHVTECLFHWRVMWLPLVSAPHLGMFCLRAGSKSNTFDKSGRFKFMSEDAEHVEHEPLQIH